MLLEKNVENQKRCCQVILKIIDIQKILKNREKWVTNELSKSSNIRVLKVYIKDTARNDTSHDIVHDNNKLNTTNKDSFKKNDTEHCGKLSGPIIHNPSKNIKLGDLNPNTVISSTQNIQIPYSLDLLNESLKKAVQQLPKDIISKVIVNFNGEIINVPQSEVITIDPLNVSNVIMGLNNVSKNKCMKNSPERIIKESVTLDPSIVKLALSGTDKSEVHNKFNMESFNKSSEINIPTPMQNTPVIFPVSQYQVRLVF